MASAAGVAMSDADLVEQQRRLMLIDQVRTDREYAERIFQEQFETPPGSPQPSTSNRSDSRAASNSSRRGRNMSNQTARSRGQSTSSASSSTGPSNGGGPIRRGANRGRGSISGAGRGPRLNAATSRGSIASTRGSTASTRGNTAPTQDPEPILYRGPRFLRQENHWLPARPRGRRGQRRNTSSNRPQMRFNGAQVEVVTDNEVVNVTGDTSFPNSDDDSDYAAGSQQVARRGANRPSVSASYIHRLLHEEIMRDNSRDRNYRPHLLRAEDDDDDDDDDEDEEDEEEEEDSDLDSDDEDVMVMDEVGPLRAERNHIDQPIFDEDRDMYSRELDLYQDDDEYQVPPPKTPKKKGGKVLEADPTWGDCTMCSNTPVKPQGCKKCLQFLGCADCVRRWHGARQSTLERPNCPLCRAPWNSHTPGVSLMPTIEKNREKLAAKNVKNGSSSTGPSTSSST